jgi:hypothetical protein
MVDVHTFRTPAKPHTSKPKEKKCAHSSTQPYERLVEISCFFIVVSGFGLQRQTWLRGTPVCGPVHSDACLHAPAPPPAGCFHCQQVSHVPVREKGPGNAHFALQSESVVKIVHTFNTPAKSQTRKLKKKKCARGISPPHARMVKFSGSVWNTGSDKGWAKKEKVWGLWVQRVVPKHTSVPQAVPGSRLSRSARFLTKAFQLGSVWTK